MHLWTHLDNILYSTNGLPKRHWMYMYAVILYHCVGNNWSRSPEKDIIRNLQSRSVHQFNISNITNYTIRAMTAKKLNSPWTNEVYCNKNHYKRGWIRAPVHFDTTISCWIYCMWIFTYKIQRRLTKEQVSYWDIMYLLVWIHQIKCQVNIYLFIFCYCNVKLHSGFSVVQPKSFNVDYWWTIKSAWCHIQKSPSRRHHNAKFRTLIELQNRPMAEMSPLWLKL